MKKIYIIILSALFCLLIFVEYNRPKSVDWSLSFGMNSKKPYGCYALHRLLNTSFLSGNININNEGFYLNSKKKRNSEKKNFIIITSTFDPDKLDLEAMLGFIKEGNEAFISALFFNKKFLDTLNLGHVYEWGSYIPVADVTEKAKIFFTNPKLKNWKSYSVEKNYTNYFFSSFDTLKTTVLGKDESGRVNFIGMNLGKGKIYINSMPFVFTNYNLLFGNYEYTFKALSYLPNKNIIWDEYYKPEKPIVATPLRYILSQPPLKAAYIVLLIALFLYIIFEAKRKQRIIPIVKPLKNTSLEFAETVGRLYLNNANHQDMALKKFNYFCELLRTKYFFTTIDFTEKFYHELSEKSGVEYKSIEKIFLISVYYKTHSDVSEDSLIRFNTMIEEFWRKAK